MGNSGKSAAGLRLNPKRRGAQLAAMGEQGICSHIGGSSSMHDRRQTWEAFPSWSGRLGSQRLAAVARRAEQSRADAMRGVCNQRVRQTSCSRRFLHSMSSVLFRSRSIFSRGSPKTVVLTEFMDDVARAMGSQNPEERSEKLAALAIVTNAVSLASGQPKMQARSSLRRCVVPHAPRRVFSTARGCMGINIRKLFHDFARREARTCALREP